MITQLNISNFCAFKKLDIDFSPKINVIIGENSFGKTQLLKAAYTLGKFSEYATKTQKITKPQASDWLTKKLLGVYKPSSNKLAGLYHRGGEENAIIQIEDATGHRLGATFSRKGIKAQPLEDYKRGSTPGVFIPAKEVLTLLPGISEGIASPEVLASLFDDSVIDLCSSLLIEPSDDIEVRVNADPRLGEILPELVNAIKGRYVISKKHHCFIAGMYEERKAKAISQSRQAKVYSDATTTRFVPIKGAALSSNMTAEGYRKIGVLQGLLINGVIDPGVTGPLFWDEPESNMNPKLMELLVKVLLQLSRNGQQIILATHDYVLLKWFDLLMDQKGKQDHIRFHALYRTDSGEIGVESTDSYKDLNSNAIASTFSKLYDAEIERSLGSTAK